MNITVGSIFRTSTEYIDRYVDQVYRFANSKYMHPHGLNIIAVEGDSTDDTRATLARELMGSHLNYILKKADHGGPDFGKVDDSRRWSQISFACNKVLDSIGPGADIFVYVESDLIWSPETMVSLIQNVVAARNAVYTCMVFNGGDGSFWDTWAFRKNGIKFGHWPPYHVEIEPSHLFTKVDSCGSILAMSADVARRCRFSAMDGIVGWCRDIYEHGYPIFLDTKLSIVHPSTWHAPKEN